MKRWLGVLGLVLVGLGMCACSPEGTDINLSQIFNFLGGGGSTGPTPDLPGTTPAKVNLGCFGMANAGSPLPECGANLATYTGPVGTHGTLDATPLDSAGNKIDGLSVQSWDVAPASGGPCSVTGETQGSDGFNPSIELTDVGCCAITVTVAGKVGGPRQFCGQ